MKTSPIKTSIVKLPKAALKSVNTIGSATIKSKNNMVKFISNHTKDFAKSEKVSDFANKMKENTVNIKLPGFLKTALAFVKDHKETFVGGAVVVAAIACARAIIGAMTSNIKQTAFEEVSRKSVSGLHTHQG